LTSAVQTIRLEHFNVASVLVCLRYLVDQIEKGRWQPDFELLASVVTYMESFPEVMHHPKEENYLFKALLRRDPGLAKKLDLVRAEHVEGAAKLQALRGALAAYRCTADAFNAFKLAADDYVVFERRHMKREERELLPLALKLLTDEDWKEIDAAFARNDDPLFGRERKREFGSLLQHILDLAPSPFGFATQEAEAR